MSYSKNKRQSRQSEKKYPLGLLLPIIALLAVIPLITFMYNYDTLLDRFEWYTSYANVNDFFLYYKMVWVIIACVYMIFCLVYLFFAEEQNPIWIKKLIPLAVYCGISIISAIASKYSYFSVHGIYEQFEPVWMLIGYGIMAYYSFYIMHYEGALKRTMNWFVAGITVMTALGLTQVFKHDFFRTSFGQKLMTPSSYNGDPLTFNFELGRPYLSLYNPNYVGFYTALVIPILVVLIFSVRKLWLRIAYAALIAALLLILFASQSRAGIVALAVSFLVMFLCMRKVFIKNWKIGISAIVVVIAAFFLINAMNQNVLLSRLQGMFTNEPEFYSLKEIQTNEDNVTVVYQTSEEAAPESLEFYVTQESDGSDTFTLKDSAGKEVGFQLSEDGVNYNIQDERFPFTFCSVRDDSFQGFGITINGNPWYFSNLMKEGNSGYYCRSTAGTLMKLARITDKDRVNYLEKHYKLANMRGYLWSRTIPLLKKYFFLGSGPDTFIIAFPNDDLVGLYNSGHVNEIITKPHCMYLQVGVQTGVISLLALLIFFGWYLIDCLLIYWKNSYGNYASFLGVGIMASTIGYLILSLTNDSCVAISPIFYTLIGIGLGINHKLRLEMPKPEGKTAAVSSKKAGKETASQPTGKDNNNTSPSNQKTDNKTNTAEKAKDRNDSKTSSPDQKTDNGKTEAPSKNNSQKTSGSTQKNGNRKKKKKKKK